MENFLKEIESFSNIIINLFISIFDKMINSSFGQFLLSMIVSLFIINLFIYIMEKIKK